MSTIEGSLSEYRVTDYYAPLWKYTTKLQKKLEGREEIDNGHVTIAVKLSHL